MYWRNIRRMAFETATLVLMIFVGLLAWFTVLLYVIGFVGRMVWTTN